MPIAARDVSECLCCGSSVRREATIVSPFLAKRAWGGNPELTSILFCGRCGFRFFERGLSSEEASNYYSTYRDNEYYRERHRFEPFYTLKVHRGIEEWLRSKPRRTALAETLELAGAPKLFSAALDYGGGTGQMLLDIPATTKAVFDLGDFDAEPGITRIRSRESIGNGWDLVLSCQVLEHLSDPVSFVNESAQLLSKDGWFYVEVPDEMWKNLACSGSVRNAWLAWVAKKRFPLIAADCLSTATRIKLGVLPPMGFVPMREHLNYFTVEALSRLLQRANFSVEWSGRNSQNCVCAVGRKK